MRPTAGDEPPPYGPGSSMRVTTAMTALLGWRDPVNEPAPEKAGLGVGLGLGLGAQVNRAAL